jgi:hypothetical protein
LKSCRQGRTLGLTLITVRTPPGGADPGDEILTGWDAELGEDVPEVGLDSLDADAQLGGRLAVGVACGDEAGHCLLGGDETDEGEWFLAPRGQ